VYKASESDDKLALYYSTGRMINLFFIFDPVEMEESAYGGGRNLAANKIDSIYTIPPG